jgi:hypothetical protein
MGKVITPKYRIEYRTNLLAIKRDTPDLYTFDHKYVKTMIWNVTNGPNRVGLGRPSKDNLTKWLRSYNDSFRKGGCNYHVSLSAKTIVNIHWARIIEQKTGRIVVEYMAPMFEAV